MNTRFSLKLAWRNIQSNKQVYLPYTFSSILTVAMFQMMVSLMMNPYVEERSSTLVQLFGLGTVVIVLFSFIFIFYTNSFLMKRRKKELGLYNVLGLEKKHVRKVLGVEALIIGSFSIFVGALVGNLFGQLSFLFLNYLLQLPVPLDYALSWEANGLTAILFVGIFVSTLLYNMAQVTFSNPIKLLKGGNEGEKEPKSSPILFVLGLISLGAGYMISLRIQDPISAITQFFLTVLLVIIGTYLLFTAGSIIVLKALKKNNAFYYRPGPFISISGMLYRMKQHGVGLANISILSVMVIIAVSTTATLFVGTEEILDNRFPEENNISVVSDYGLPAETFKSDTEQLERMIKNLTVEQGYQVKSEHIYRYVSLMGEITNQTVERKEFEFGKEIPQMIMMMSVEDYNHMANESLTLNENELYIFDNRENLSGTQLELGGQIFHAKRLKEIPPLLELGGGGLVESLIIVLSDINKIEEIAAYFNPESSPYMMSWNAGVHWDTTAVSSEKKTYGNTMNQSLRDLDLDIGVFYESRSVNREEWYSMNGGFLFLGLFLGGLFTIGTALITYFKQVSEGYDDRERIQIMQKVGLDKETTRRATQSQILWMFILPMLTAGMHTAFAYPILQKLLELFGVMSQQLLINIILIVLFVFALLYYFIYQITTKVYLRIVEK